MITAVSYLMMSVASVLNWEKFITGRETITLGFQCTSHKTYIQENPHEQIYSLARLPPYHFKVILSQESVCQLKCKALCVRLRIIFSKNYAQESSIDNLGSSLIGLYAKAVCRGTFDSRLCQAVRIGPVIRSLLVAGFVIKWGRHCTIDKECQRRIVLIAVVLLAWYSSWARCRQQTWYNN